MTVKLEALLDAWDKTTGGGRDEDKARTIAKDYVAAHPADFKDLEGKTVDELVAMVDHCREIADLFRKGGMDADASNADAQKLRIDVLLLTQPKRHIGGTDASLNAVVRLPGKGN